jgi:hypothetical protein
MIKDVMPKLLVGPLPDNRSGIERNQGLLESIPHLL